MNGNGHGDGDGNGHSYDAPGGLPHVLPLIDDLRAMLNEEFAAISSLVSMSETSMSDHTARMTTLAERVLAIVDQHAREIVAIKARLAVLEGAAGASRGSPEL